MFSSCYFIWLTAVHLVLGLLGDLSSRINCFSRFLTASSCLLIRPIDSPYTHLLLECRFTTRVLSIECSSMCRRDVLSHSRRCCFFYMLLKLKYFERLQSPIDRQSSCRSEAVSSLMSWTPSVRCVKSKDPELGFRGRITATLRHCCIN